MARWPGGSNDSDPAGKPFVQLLSAPGFSLELYRPGPVDLQTPHDLDELYVVATGASGFVCQGERCEVTLGDALFVPAGADHRFVDIGGDFAVWVVFIGSTDAAPASAQDEPAVTDIDDRF